MLTRFVDPCCAQSLPGYKCRTHRVYYGLRQSSRQMTSLALFGLLLFVSYAQCSAPSGPWDALNFAPKARLVYPQSVREVKGNVSNADGVLPNGSVTLGGDGSYITFDFGLEVSSSLHYVGYHR